MGWLIAIGIALMVLSFMMVVAGVGIFLFLRSRKASAVNAGSPPPAGLASGRPAPAPQSPRGPLVPVASGPPPRVAMPAGETDRTIAIPTGPVGMPGQGTLICTTGPLAGRSFPLSSDGLYVGRDQTVSQIVVEDSRISKRHVWIGIRNGQAMAVDSGSTNGTFVNVPASQRITEVVLNSGDTVIVSDDVARFQYQR